MSPAEDCLLVVEGLSARYGAVPVLAGVDLRVRKAGITALLGANGAGKTTTLRAICGMVSRQGSIRLNGVRLDTLRTEAIVAQGVAHVPEGRGTFLHLTVAENLRLGAWLRKDRPAVAADIERVLTYFPRLRERWQQPAGTLSGGEQQMLAVSRALMLRPRLLLLDEPSFGLAPLVIEELFRIFREVREREGVAMLLVEQNATLALEVADDACVLETGRVTLSGSAAAVRDNALVRASYLGV